MRFNIPHAISAYLALDMALAAAQATEDVLEVDVAIIGAGATGGYAAVRLREDFKKSVVVIEKSNRMGGHVHAYYPEGRPVNYGVQAYLDRDTTKAFFNRFGPKLVSPDLGSYLDLILKTENVDFSTGLPVDVDYGPVDIFGVPIALLRYRDKAEDYQEWFENGYFQTGEVPEDLLLPFGEFLKKHDLEASLRILRDLLWLSDPLDTPTWHVMAVVGVHQINAFGLGLFGPSFKWPATYSSETLFDNVLASMRDDVLLESTVVASQRADGDDGVSLTVQTPTGQRAIRARRLLISATPSPDNVAPWDLDADESALFDKFSWETLFVGVVGNTGLPEDVTGIRNAQADDDTLHLPNGSFCDAIQRSGDRDLFTTRIIGTADLTADGAKAVLARSMGNIASAGTYATSAVSLLAFADHGLTVPKVTSEELRDGFYNKLYALQGRRNTFWTGLTWAPDYTPILWDFTEKILPQIVEGL